MLKRAAVAFVLGASLSACGGSSPSAPSTPTVTNLTIGGSPGSLLTGQAAALTALASLSTGTSQTVTAAWQSDSASVTVDGSGRATAVTNGTATITATYQGAVARATIQSITNYQGAWSGTYVVTECDANGTWATVGHCVTFPVGTIGPISLALTQSAGSVSGTLRLGSLQGNVVAAAVRGDGHLTMTPQLQTAIGSAIATVTISGWDTMADGNSMTGTWAQDWRASTFTGNAHTQHRLVSMTRTSALIASALATDAVSFRNAGGFPAAFGVGRSAR